jgi:hypothetical protein
MKHATCKGESNAHMRLHIHSKSNSSHEKEKLATDKKERERGHHEKVPTVFSKQYFTSLTQT